MNQDMKPEFLFLADLHIFILSFLPYQDILRCTSVCRDLRQTYLSSPELQYLVELGGQQLLAVDLRVDNHCTPISERLQLLRDKAHAWFKFDTRPTETVGVPERFQHATTSVTNRHISLAGTWTLRCNPGFAKIFPILPEPSQQAIDREWHPETLFPVPNPHQIDLLMDPMQNLVAAAYDANDGSDVCINLLPLDRDGTHPQAVGPTLFTSTGLPRRLKVLWKEERWKLRGLGRHIALWHSLRLDNPDRVLWWLQIWDWQHSATSNSVLSGTVFNTNTDRLIDYCFLGNGRLLMVVGVNLRVYSIEDISQAPKSLACFLLPVPVEIAHLIPGSKNDVAYRSQPGMHQTMWTSDPIHQLLCLNTFPLNNAFPPGPPGIQFVISTSIFFDLDFLEGSATAIPWSHWGPLNARIFQHYEGFLAATGGTRVLRVVPTADRTDNDPMEYRLQVMDFSPLAAKNRQGLGRLVREPSTIDSDGELITTSMPYVEVLSSKKSIPNDELIVLSIDECRICALHIYARCVKVIKIWDGV